MTPAGRPSGGVVGRLAALHPAPATLLHVASRDASALGRYVDDVAARTGRLSRPLRVVADYGNGAGAVVERYAATPYGVGDSTTGLTPWRWTGRRLDPETGLYHLRARDYAPGIGRFVQPDPIGIAGGINLYAYVGNDPLNATDPWGLWALPAAGAAFGGLSGGYAGSGEGYERRGSGEESGRRQAFQSGRASHFPKTLWRGVSTLGSMLKVRVRSAGMFRRRVGTH